MEPETWSQFLPHPCLAHHAKARRGWKAVGWISAFSCLTPLGVEGGWGFGGVGAWGGWEWCASEIARLLSC